MKPIDDPQTMLLPLINDLRDQQGGLGYERLDYLVVSGDLAHRGKEEELDRARGFLSLLMERFGLAPQRCIIVPGNHDLDWDEKVCEWHRGRQVPVEQLQPGTYTEQREELLIRDEGQYPLRLKNFSEKLYLPLVQRPYPLAPRDQCIPFLFTDDRIQFLAMNSSWQIDRCFPQRSSIHAGALALGLDKANQQIDQAKEDGRFPSDAAVLRIGVWHHPVTGNAKITDDGFLDLLRQVDFQLCLHGHVHEERADRIGYLHPTRQLYVAGVGTFDAPVGDRPESIPRLYSVLEVAQDRSSVRVYTRCRRKGTGAWQGWPAWPHSKNLWRTYYDIPLRNA